jgi:hypothetical protein
MRRKNHFTTSRWTVLLAATVILSATGCSTEPAKTSDHEVIPRGNRLLGISISDRADGDFDAAFQQATAAGMQFTSLSLSWDDLESAEGVYGATPDFLSIANAYYGAVGTGLILGINPIDTNNKRTPSFLDGLAWDDPAVLEAYKGLLDWALPKVVGVDLVALSIGNEIDGLLANPSEWAAYTTFFEAVSAHARQIRPGLRVGTKVTVAGFAGGFATQAAAINATTEAVLTTYYPLNGDFTIKAPSTVDAVFDDVVSRFPGRTIIFAEIGSPSTAQCGSSETAQAEFVSAAFEAWDRHASVVEALEFTWMHDISQSALDTYEQYYGLSDVCFLEYLGTLGLKSFSGADKPGWTALADQATQRGW